MTRDVRPWSTEPRLGTLVAIEWVDEGLEILSEDGAAACWPPSPLAGSSSPSDRVRSRCVEPDELARVKRLSVRSWVTEGRDHWIRIDTHFVSGRRIVARMGEPSPGSDL
jgi:hypothetical protein